MIWYKKFYLMQIKVWLCILTYYIHWKRSKSFASHLKAMTLMESLFNKGYCLMTDNY